MAWVKQMMSTAGRTAVLQPEGRDLFFVWNLTAVRDTVRDLKAAFPDDTLHAFAAKANPLSFILAELNKYGLGCEAASIGEFTQGMQHFPPEKVVFDSPCKTKSELREALKTPCLLNVDNFQELNRVKEILKDSPEPSTTRLGIRVNPQVGYGSMGIFSTGTATSKFGIPLIDNRNEIVKAYKENPFLTCIHLHSGSQGCSLDLMVEGVKRVVDLADEIGDQITEIDIGGGIGVNFETDDWNPPFQEYSARLREACPNLFKRRIVTEFGRCVLAKTGVLVSKIEYTKTVGGRRIATQHAGVDLAIRTIWAPKDWPLRVTPFTSTGKPVPYEDLAPTDLAGPCCLGGDILAHQRELPPLSPDDFVVVRDVGAYYHSSYSYYNLRQAPPVFAYCEEKNTLQLVVKGATVDETLGFFSSA